MATPFLHSCWSGFRRSVIIVLATLFVSIGSALPSVVLLHDFEMSQSAEATDSEPASAHSVFHRIGMVSRLRRMRISRPGIWQESHSPPLPRVEVMLARYKTLFNDADRHALPLGRCAPLRL